MVAIKQHSITAEQIWALQAMNRLSRNFTSEATAERIAEAFSTTLKDLGLEPKSYEPGADWGSREEHYTDAPSVGVPYLAWALAKHHVRGFDPGPCPYIGVGKSAEWMTLEGTWALRERFNYPDGYYVGGIYGEPERTPDGKGYYWGSAPIIGWAIYSYKGNERRTVARVESEEAGYQWLADYAASRVVRAYIHPEHGDPVGIVNGVKYVVQQAAGFKMAEWPPNSGHKTPAETFVWAVEDHEEITACPHVAAALDSALIDWWMGVEA